MAAVVITADALRRAARAPGSSAFPFLAKFAKKPAPGCCGRAATGPDPRDAFATISKLSAERLKTFKALLGAETLVVWTVRAAKTVKLEL